MNTTYSGITILQGDDITLSCRPSQSDIALQWSYNGSDIGSLPQYQFTPATYNHDLTIINANVTDSGKYTCAVVLGNEVIDQQSITLTVVPSEYDYIIIFANMSLLIICCFLFTSLFAKLFWWFIMAYK